MRISARGSLVTATAVVTLALAGCGSAATTAPAASGGGGASGGGARMDPAQQQKIAQCLQAAGLPVPSFAPRPSRAPGEPPPTRMPGQSRGGGAFADPKVRAALQAGGSPCPPGRRVQAAAPVRAPDLDFAAPEQAAVCRLARPTAPEWPTHLAGSAESPFLRGAAAVRRRGTGRRSERGEAARGVVQARVDRGQPPSTVPNLDVDGHRGAVGGDGAYERDVEVARHRIRHRSASP